jgi:hypothetical protein
VSGTSISQSSTDVTGAPVCGNHLYGRG